MNERIKELSKKAGLCDSDGDFYSRRPSNYQKFAELIVQECVNMCNTNEDYISAFNIKEHFGVE